MTETTEKMDVDEVSVTTVTECVLNLWFSAGLLENTTRILFPLNLATCTVDQLKASIEERHNTLSAKSIDLLYNGQVIGTGTTGSSTLANLQVKANSVVNVVKKFTEKSSTQPIVPASSQKKYSPEQLHQITVALRTGFLSPAFGKTIEKLLEPEMLDNLFAIAPALVTDLIGIAIIQSPHMIFNTSEPEAMNKLAETRPWVIEAFNFIAAAIHQEKGTNAPHLPRNLLISQLLNPAVLEADEEEMEEDEDEEPEVSRSQSQPNLITREQLSQALSSIPINRGAGSSGSGRSGTTGGGSTLSSLFNNPVQSPSRPATAPASSQGAGQNLNIQSVLQNAMAAVAAGGNPGTGTPQLTPEAVSRAMQDALNRLPPEQRASQLSALRDMAIQLTSGSPRAASTSVPASPAVLPAAAHSQAEVYQQQLRQIRELGFTNDNLSILALRVSGGDVETALELLFSGWDGAGSDPEGENQGS